MNYKKNLKIKAYETDVMSLNTGAPPRKAGWKSIFVFMVADVMGVGIMGMGNAFAKLGWIMGVIFCILFLPLNIYAGCKLWEAAMYYTDHSLSLQMMARHIYGPKMQAFTAIIVYSYIIFMLGGYILAMGESLSYIFYEAEYCYEIWAVFGMLPLIPLTQTRTLTDALWLLNINVFSLIASVGIACLYVFINGVDNSREYVSKVNNFEATDTYSVSTELTYLSMAEALSSFAFAYVGTFLYLEMMSEMKDPKDFPKAFYLAGPFQLSMYMIVGVVGYQYFGDKISGLFISDSNLPMGSWGSVVSSVFLYLHVALSYLMKGTIQARVLHQYFFGGESLSNYSIKGRILWFVSTFGLLIACYLIAVLIPDFSALTDLLGSLQTPIFGFILPMLFANAAYKEMGKKIGYFEMGLQLFLWALSIYLLIFGCWANIQAIIDTWQAKTPFTTC